MRSLPVIVGIVVTLALVSLAFAGMNVLEYPDSDMGKVTFNGKLHNEKLGPGKCMECHKGNIPFAMKKPGMEGSVKITQEDHIQGTYCGTCHDGTKSFGWQEGSDCTKCHISAEAPMPAEEVTGPAEEAPAEEITDEETPAEEEPCESPEPESTQ